MSPPAHFCRTLCDVGKIGVALGGAPSRSRRAPPYPQVGKRHINITSPLPSLGCHDTFLHRSPARTLGRERAGQYCGGRRSLRPSNPSKALTQREIAPTGPDLPRRLQRVRLGNTDMQQGTCPNATSTAAGALDAAAAAVGGMSAEGSGRVPGCLCQTSPASGFPPSPFVAGSWLIMCTVPC